MTDSEFLDQAAIAIMAALMGDAGRSQRDSIDCATRAWEGAARLVSKRSYFQAYREVCLPADEKSPAR